MFMGLWAFLLVGAVVAAITWAAQQRTADSVDQEALSVLERRLAAGDVTVDDYDERRRALFEARPRSLRSWPVIVVALATVATVGVLFAALANGSWWGPGGSWMGSHMDWIGATDVNSPVVEGAPSFEVRAGDLWFEPERFEVPAGEPVNITLDNDGQSFHDFTIAVADFTVAAEPGTKARGSLTMTEPGEYQFYCSVPGHAQGGMRGTIVVPDEVPA